MENMIIGNEKTEFEFDPVSGSISGVWVKNGKIRKNILGKPVELVDGYEYESVDTKIIEETNGYIKIQTICKDGEDIIEAQYEFFDEGYVVISFRIKSTKKNKFEIEVGLNRELFNYGDMEIINGPEETGRREHRAMSLDFSIDGKNTTGAVGLMLEGTKRTDKIFKVTDDRIFMGYSVGKSTDDKAYANRICLAVTNIDDGPNMARGQRIYHWYGMYPRYPSDDLLEEMAEYGCSVLILHMSVFQNIDGSVPADEVEMKRTVEKAKSLGMKIMFYCQPFLISHNSPGYERLAGCVNNNARKVWNSLKTSQIVFYEPNTDYDCDELCIRCPEAYEYMKNSVLATYRKYGFDGLYVDFAWPGQGICSDPAHGHPDGVFNFYDYYRMIREWRREIGSDAIMIGHGGGLMVPADFVQSFDGCLTGEAQKELDPEILAIHCGCAPMLWTMHRRKQREFRSADTIYGIIKEGVTPHIGLGIMGKSIIASLDAAHTPVFLALWQMLRAFPVEKAFYYNYRNAIAVSIDNDEVAFSLYVTEDGKALLLLANGGGRFASGEYSVGVNIKLNLKELGLPDEMKCRRMKGDRYENFRILPEETITDGMIKVPEIGINELVGFVLSPNGKVKELDILEKNLNGRYERLSQIYAKKMKRLLWSDTAIMEFNRRGAYNPDEEEFMKNREME